MLINLLWGVLRGHGEGLREATCYVSLAKLNSHRKVCLLPVNQCIGQHTCKVSKPGRLNHRPRRRVLLPAFARAHPAGSISAPAYPLADAE